MAERLEVYKCNLCGNIVEVMHGGAGELVCCGEPMKLFVENTVDAAKEKHVPVIEKTAEGFKVKVGSVRRSITLSGSKLWPAAKPTVNFSNLEKHPKPPFA